jgi:hypothetical protein
MSDWTITTLKEHIEALLSERDKALKAALVSINDRLKLLNELRGGVATKDEVKALDKIVEDLKTRLDRTEGRGAGYSQSWAVFAAIATLVIAIIYLIIRSKP